jgi:GTP cyclohydrolase I
MRTDYLSNQKVSKSLSDFDFEEIGDEHLYTGLQTPMRDDAFVLTDQQKERENSPSFRANHARNGIRPYR